MILIFPILLIVGLGPSLLVWALAAYFSSEIYDVKPYRMLLVSFAIAFCIGAVFNVELEAGLASGIVFMVVVTFAVTLVFMPITLMYEWYKLNREKNV